MSPLQVALVGGGSMGSLHARVLSQDPRTNLACVVDPDPEVGKRLAEAHTTRWLPDLDGLGFVDAVVVASPTETHPDWVEPLLAAGKPVLVEKPLATDLDHVIAMVKRAAEADVPLMCGFVERWNPAVMLAREIVNEPVYFQAFRHSPYAERVKGGVASDLLIHDVDVALQIFGESPRDVRSTLGFFHPQSLPSAEDVAEVQLVFSEGQIATASASRIAQRKVRNIVISETDRLVELDLLRQDVIVYRHVLNEMLGDTGGYRQQTVIDIPVIPSRREPLASQLDHFIALINGRADHVAERDSLIPPHAVIDLVLAAGQARGATATDEP